MKQEEDKYYGLTDLTIWNVIVLVVNYCSGDFIFSEFLKTSNVSEKKIPFASLNN